MNWTKKIWITVLGLLAMSALAWLPYDQAYLTSQAQTQAAHKLLQHLHQNHRPSRQGTKLNVAPDPKGSKIPKKRFRVRLQCQPSPCPKSLRQKLSDDKVFQFVASHTGATSQPTSGAALATFRFNFQAPTQAKGVLWGLFQEQSLHASLQLYNTAQQPLLAKAPQQRQKLVHWTAVLPPLVAIFFVLLTRQLILSLMLSLFFGVLLHVQGRVFDAVYHMGYTYVWKEGIYQEFSINIILFTLSLIGMINVCSRNGGVQGMIDRLKGLASTPRSSRLITALLGIVVFFDDYANSILVGNTMRPLTDRYRISREKLAYLVDSTAAPIAGVALLSTWIGYEVGLLGKLTATLGLQTSGYELFLSSLGFRFYCWMTLIFVFMGVLMNRDFGPMLKAERRAWEEGKLLRDGATPLVNHDLSRVEPEEGIPHRWYNALLPILLVLVAGFLGLLYSGGYFSEGVTLRQALSDANNTRVFLIASLLGSALAILLSLSQRLLTLGQALSAWGAGARAMLFAIGILIFAWSMGALSKELGSAHYLIALLKSSLTPQWVPLLIFFMSAIISFATGTSWGTMSILLPTAAPLAYEVGLTSSLGGLGLLALSVGAVLDGSIFGDHCSPLSDTTLFSSAATACDHVDHVNTQAPYAITVMGVSSLFGYLAYAYYGNFWLSFGGAFLAFLAIFSIFGKPTNPALAQAQ